MLFIFSPPSQICFLHELLELCELFGSCAVSSRHQLLFNRVELRGIDAHINETFASSPRLLLNFLQQRIKRIIHLNSSLKTRCHSPARVGCTPARSRSSHPE